MRFGSVPEFPKVVTEDTLVDLDLLTKVGLSPENLELWSSLGLDSIPYRDFSRSKFKFNKYNDSTYYIRELLPKVLEILPTLVETSFGYEYCIREGLVDFYHLYDFKGRLIRERDSKGYSNYKEYDSLGNLVRTELGDLVCVYIYDSSNRCVEVETRMSGGLIEYCRYTYDSEGREVLRVNSSGYTIFHEYDSNGILRKRGSGDDLFEYDSLGRITRSERTGLLLEPGRIIVEETEYPSPGKVLTRKYLDGELVSRKLSEFDSNQNCLSCRDLLSDFWHTSTYNSRGQRLTYRSSEVEDTLFDYSESGQLLQITEGGQIVLEIPEFRPC